MRPTTPHFLPNLDNTCIPGPTILFHGLTVLWRSKWLICLNCYFFLELCQSRYLLPPWLMSKDKWCTSYGIIPNLKFRGISYFRPNTEKAWESHTFRGTFRLRRFLNKWNTMLVMKPLCGYTRKQKTVTLYLFKTNYGYIREIELRLPILFLTIPTFRPAFVAVPYLGVLPNGWKFL